VHVSGDNGLQGALFHFVVLILSQGLLIDFLISVECRTEVYESYCNATCKRRLEEHVGS